MIMIYSYFLAIKHKIEIGCISITRSCAWSNTGSHLLKAQDKLKTFKGVFNYDPADEKQVYNPFPNFREEI